jgi:hypothetical protein
MGTAGKVELLGDRSPGTKNRERGYRDRSCLTVAGADLDLDGSMGCRPEMPSHCGNVYEPSRVKSLGRRAAISAISLPTIAAGLRARSR